MDLHALLNPAIALDCCNQCTDAGTVIADLPVADIAFEGQLTALDPANPPEVSLAATALAPDTGHAPEPDPDPVANLVEALTGISSAVPVRRVKTPLPEAEAKTLPATLPADSDGSELTTPRPTVEVAPEQTVMAQPAPVEPAKIPELQSPARDVEPPTSQLPPVPLAQTSPPPDTMHKGEAKTVVPNPDMWNPQGKMPSRNTALPRDNSAVTTDSPPAAEPDFRPEAEIPPPPTGIPRSKAGAISSEPHAPAEVTLRATAEAPGIGSTASLPVPGQAIVAAPAEHARDGSKQPTRLTHEDFLLPRTDHSTVSLRPVEGRDTRPLSAFQDDMIPDLSSRNAPYKTAISTISTPDASVRHSDSLPNTLHASSIREFPANPQALPPPEARTAPANPASIIRQVADAIVTTRNEMVEITLSPEELGRVRMVLTGHERAPHLAIWAERPDILDQMRRNADLLMQEFSDEGFSDATLSFEGDRRGGRDNPARDELPWEDRVSPAESITPRMAGDPQTSPVPMTIESRRIDVRM